MLAVVVVTGGGDFWRLNSTHLSRCLNIILLLDHHIDSLTLPSVVQSYDFYARHQSRLLMAKIVRRWLLELIKVGHTSCTIHTGSISIATCLSALSDILASWHFQNLRAVPHILHILSIVVLFSYDGLSIEKTFRKGVVLSLNALSLFLSLDKIQTGRFINPILRGRGSLTRLCAARGWNRGPFSIRNVHKFAKQNLILFADCDIFL